MKRRSYPHVEGHRLTVQLHDHPADPAYRPGRDTWNGHDLVLHVQVWVEDDEVPEAEWQRSVAVVTEALWADAPVETELAGQLLHYDEQVVLVQAPDLASDELLDMLATQVLRLYVEGALAEQQLDPDL